MKKFIVFFLICSILFGVSLFKKEFDFSSYSNLQVQIYTSKKCNNKVKNADYLDNGQGEIIFCDYDTYKLISSTEKNISGVTYIFSGNKQVFEDVISSLKVDVVEKSDTSFLGYTNSFSLGVDYQNKKVNVQGYYSDGRIFIGTPLLLGSY